MIHRISTMQGSLALPDAWGIRLENAHALRYAISVAAGLVTTLLLFLLMQALIKSDMSPFSDPGKGQILQFVRMQEEVEVPPSYRRPVEDARRFRFDHHGVAHRTGGGDHELKQHVAFDRRSPPKPLPPPDEMPPDMTKPEFDGKGTKGVEIGPGKIPIEPGLVRPEFKADGEYLPITKVAPVYPRRAQQGGKRL